MNEDKIYCTQDDRQIDYKNIWELDKDGYVISSFRLVFLDFSK